MSALRLELSPSPRFASLIVVLHAAAGASALVVLGGIAGGLLCAALIGLGAAAAWSRALHRASGSVRSLELEGAAAALGLADGRRLTGELGARRFVSRFAVALPFGTPARRTLFVTPDMLDARSFRVLRLWALWGKLSAVAVRQLKT